jgi:putative ABC transport system substrate-binding protein
LEGIEHPPDPRTAAIVILGVLSPATGIAPGVTRAAVVRDPAISAGIGVFGAIQSTASSLGVEVSPVNARDSGEMEGAIETFARATNGGLIVTPSALATVHRGLLVALAARHRLPAVYFAPYFVTSGGLVSYGPDPIDQYRQAAGYVDRVLRGERLSFGKAL